jgi:hypothetical protein
VALFKKIFKKINYLIQVSGYSRRYYRNDGVLKKLFLEHSNKGETMSLDIGSGPVPKNPFGAKAVHGVDFRENKENKVLYADFSVGQLPFSDQSYDFATAFDLYFCKKAWARIYGFSGSFELMDDGWVGDKYFCFMKKVGVDPIFDLNFKQE